MFYCLSIFLLDFCVIVTKKIIRRKKKQYHQTGSTEIRCEVIPIAVCDLTDIFDEGKRQAFHPSESVHID